MTVFDRPILARAQGWGLDSPESLRAFDADFIRVGRQIDGIKRRRLFADQHRLKYCLTGPVTVSAALGLGDGG